jgi:RNA-directed DNA polymerase
MPEGFRPEPDLPERLSLLRWKLDCKAKREPQFRFYALYAHIYRPDTLKAAWRQAKSKRGAPGVDGVTFSDIENLDGGMAGFLEGLRKELQAKTYRPKPVKRTYIPKPDGRKRPLGIPCIRDRVVQTAVKLIIEPIFEADFQPCSHGFRPQRGAHEAIKEITANLKAGRKAIYDADLTSYFDTIDHKRLMEQIERRITDRSILRLIRMWLQCTIEEKDENGRTRRIKPKRGTPQGGVISPLLANIYLHQLDEAFETEAGSPRQFANARLIRYADDFVVMARYISGRITRWLEHKLENELELTVNREKTQVVNLRKEGENLDFLGFTLRYDRDLHGRPHRYLNVFPSDKAMKRVRERVREMTCSGYKRSLRTTIHHMNDLTRGWKNYFQIGYPRKRFRDVNWYILRRFEVFLRHRSQRKCKPLMDGESLYAGLRRMGLIPL